MYHSLLFQFSHAPSASCLQPHSTWHWPRDIGSNGSYTAVLACMHTHGVLHHQKTSKQTKQHVFPYLSFLCLTAVQKKLSLPSFILLPKTLRIRKQEKLTKKPFFFFASVLLLKASKLFAFLYPTLEKKGSFSLSLLIQKMTSFISPSGLLSQSFYMASHFSVNSSWISC